jgi:conjugal transfer mating pair stabilization protein TraN
MTACLRGLFAAALLACAVSALSDGAYAGDGTCRREASTCVDGPSTKLVSGYPVQRDCWRYQERYTCVSERFTSECGSLLARGCSQIGSKCIDTLPDGTCSTYEQRYECGFGTTPTNTVLNCGTQTFCLNGSCFDTGYPPDADFGRVVAMKEAVRQAGYYLDPATQQVFRGASSTCSIKLFGLGNCCKSASGGSSLSNDQVLGNVFNNASGFLHSTYLYDALFASDMPDWLFSNVSSLMGLGTAAWSPSVSFYGVTATFVEGTVVFAFDPWSAALAVAIYVVTEALKCDQAENVLAMRRGQNLCVHVGTYCSSKILGACVTRKQSYCCFNSRLARIINEQGRAQLGRAYGDASSPDCSGITVDELQRLDFSRMDLSAFYAEIVAKVPDVPGLTSRIQNRVTSTPNASYFPAQSPP